MREPPHGRGRDEDRERAGEAEEPGGQVGKGDVAQDAGAETAGVPNGAVAVLGELVVGCGGVIGCG